jgi:type I restriction enzyme S subunit
MKLSTKTLGELCDEGGGEIRTGPFGSQLHQSDYSASGIPVVMPKDIIEGKISEESIARISIEHVSRLSQHKLTRGDIIYGRRGDIGRQALITTKEDGWICGTGCLRVSLGNAVIDPQFLHYYLCDKSVIKDISNQAVGATMPNLNTTILRRISISYPTKANQHRIASILSAYDDLIENNTRRIAILEEMARRIYEEWFVHFRFPGHKKVKMVESELGLIPEGWRIYRFSELLSSYGGGDWGSDKPNDKYTVGVSVIRGTDFDDLTNGKPFRNPKRYIESKSYQKRKIIAGDLIVENSINAKSRSSGKTLLITKGVLGYLSGKAIPASFCKLFRFKEPKLSVLAHMKMKSLFESGDMAFYQNVAANGIANFQAVRFVETEYLVIPNDESLLEKMLGLISNLNSSVYAEKNTNLRATRDLLLPKLISGEIDLSNAVEGAKKAAAL